MRAGHHRNPAFPYRRRGCRRRSRCRHDRRGSTSGRITAIRVGRRPSSRGRQPYGFVWLSPSVKESNFKILRRWGSSDGYSKPATFWNRKQLYGSAGMQDQRGEKYSGAQNQVFHFNPDILPRCSYRELPPTLPDRLAAGSQPERLRTGW